LTHTSIHARLRRVGRRARHGEQGSTDGLTSAVAGVNLKARLREMECSRPQAGRPGSRLMGSRLPGSLRRLIPGVEEVKPWLKES